VQHAALPGSPGHEHWAAISSAAAGLLTLEFDPAISPESVDAFVDGLQLFRIGWSWGGPVSLAVPYQTPRMRQLGSGYEGVIVRLCIGLEATDDLIADLQAALDRLRREV
jgi:cysteine-S-conjugate beta-lyase